MRTCREFGMSQPCFVPELAQFAQETRLVDFRPCHAQPALTVLHPSTPPIEPVLTGWIRRIIAAASPVSKRGIRMQGIALPYARML